MPAGVPVLLVDTPNVAAQPISTWFTGPGKYFEAGNFAVRLTAGQGPATLKPRNGQRSSGCPRSPSRPGKPCVRYWRSNRCLRASTRGTPARRKPVRAETCGTHRPLHDRGDRRRRRPRAWIGRRLAESSSWRPVRHVDLPLLARRRGDRRDAEGPRRRRRRPRDDRHEHARTAFPPLPGPGEDGRAIAAALERHAADPVPAAAGVETRAGAGRARGEEAVGAIPAVDHPLLPQAPTATPARRRSWRRRVSPRGRDRPAGGTPRRPPPRRAGGRRARQPRRPTRAGDARRSRPSSRTGDRAAASSSICS